MSSDEKVTVIISIQDRVAAAEMPEGTFQTLSEQRTALVQNLQTQARTSQANLLTNLETLQAAGEVDDIISLWIINAISVRASAAAIQKLTVLPEVVQIAPEMTFQAPAAPVSSATATANLDQIGVTRVWELGYHGQGVVIASLDTGVNYTHPDLATQWRGGTNSWYDPYNEHPDAPYDSIGHGTWTMGVMVGDSASGTAVGVAPQAQWIAAKIFDDSGTASETAIHQSYQWILDPDGNPKTDDAPDVVNNSWGYGMIGCVTNLQGDLVALREAGILPIFSAGNSGPEGSTSVSPANNPEAFSVGAVNTDLSIHETSGRGPSACEGDDVYPDVVAPGENIYTTDSGGGYSSQSGTSLSAPHVSGALALILSAKPHLSVSQQEELLRNSATDLGPSGPDDAFGYGLIDVWNAIQQLDITPIEDQTPVLFIPLIANDWEHP